MNQEKQRDWLDELLDMPSDDEDDGVNDIATVESDPNYCNICANNTKHYSPKLCFCGVPIDTYLRNNPADRFTGDLIIRGKKHDKTNNCEQQRLYQRPFGWTG